MWIDLIAERERRQQLRQSPGHGRLPRRHVRLAEEGRGQNRSGKDASLEFLEIPEYDETSQRVPEDIHRQAGGQIGRNGSPESFEIFEIAMEVTNVSAPPVGSAVTTLVERVDIYSVPSQIFSEGGVSPGMLTETMHDQECRCWGRGLPGLIMESETGDPL